jgi:hypothetical protein
MNKYKLLFVYDHPNPDMWLDGLSAALDLLEEDLEVSKINLYGIPNPSRQVVITENPDFVLGWGAFGSKVDEFVHPYGTRVNCRIGLCIGGNAMPPTSASFYDVLFYETKWYRPQIDFHPNIVQAFGVNTDIYTPMDIPTPIVWDYIGVGALANWKRWEKMGDKEGNRLVIGEYQTGNEQESLEIARNLLKKGVMVSNMVSPFELSLLYQYSRALYIPSTVLGGGERAVLEARSMGLSVEIEPDNDKLKELVEMEKIPSHIDYSKQLKNGILSVL